MRSDLPYTTGTSINLKSILKRQYLLHAYYFIISQAPKDKQVTKPPPTLLRQSNKRNLFLVRTMLTAQGISQFYSDKKLKLNDLNLRDASNNKKSRSFSQKEIEENTKKTPKRIFACEPDNEGSETLSEVSEKLRMSLGSTEECKGESPIESNIKMELEVKPKKRPLLGDFHERFEMHKMEIKVYQSKEQQLKAASMDKHPNSLKRRLKVYKKSTFYLLRQKELNLNSDMSIFTDTN